MLCLPAIPGDALQPQDAGAVAWGIVKVLSLSIGLPFFVLATTGPLIQAWHNASDGIAESKQESGQSRAGSPYRLYALSNIGSLLALLSYPFLIEPFLPIRTQSILWSLLFVAFGSLCFFSGAQVRNCESWNSPFQGEPVSTQRVGGPRMMIWLLLAMVPSILLLATTNLMVQEIASVPLLWVLPLVLYLLSFIICFEYPALFRRSVFVPLLLVGVIAGVIVALLNVHASAALQIGLLCLSLFACSMSCHGELERLKPHANRLTLFYLFVSLGGSLGGMFVVLLAPRLFRDFAEFQIGLIAALLLGLAIPCVSSSLSLWKRYAIGFCGILVGGVAVASLAASFEQSSREHILFADRNEYGIVSVEQRDGRRIFFSGNIDHGSQRFDPRPSLDAHRYYAAGSGFSVALEVQRELAKAQTVSRDGIHVGVLGLGIGAMLSWTEPEDRFTFYEINPQVEQIAREWFTFLPTYDQQSEVIIGDGRIMLQREAEAQRFRQFDVLAIDAFSSDSIPIHLLTDECFDVYLQHLKPNGILLFHVTNRFIDLKPVLFEGASWRRLEATYLSHAFGASAGDKGKGAWVVVCKPELSQHRLIQAAAIDYETPPGSSFWSDDFSSITPLIDWSFGIDWEQMLHKIRHNAEQQE